MRLVRATKDEKSGYSGIHPLYGWVQAGGYRLAVEYLGEGRGEANYEVLAPVNLTFEPDGTTSLLASTQSELMERLAVSFWMAKAPHSKGKGWLMAIYTQYGTPVEVVQHTTEGAAIIRYPDGKEREVYLFTLKADDGIAEILEAGKGKGKG